MGQGIQPSTIIQLDVDLLQPLKPGRAIPVTTHNLDPCRHHDFWQFKGRLLATLAVHLGARRHSKGAKKGVVQQIWVPSHPALVTIQREELGTAVLLL